MIEHFKNLQKLQNKVNVQIPNGIFNQLSESVTNSKGKKNSQQASFAYAYLVALAFLYKYANFVDLDNKTYIQNSDLKELLGYSKTTKSIDRIIAKNGILEKMNLIETTKDCPVRYRVNKQELENGLPRWDFVMRSELLDDDILIEEYNRIVKNRNYEIREPIFLTTTYPDNEDGTLYDYRDTHEITIQEFITFISDPKMNNLDFMLYAFFKAKCKGFDFNARRIPLERILLELGFDGSTFYQHLTLLKERNFIVVQHSKWKMPNPEKFIKMVSNEYRWKGVS